MYRVCAIGGNHPSWSPDGRSIVVMSARNNTALLQLYILDVQRQAYIPLSETRSYESSPDWSR